MSIRQKQSKKKRFQPFLRTAFWIVERIGPERMPGQREKTEEYLRVRYFGQKRPSLKEYWAKRLAVLLAGAFWGSLSLLLMALVLEENPKERAWSEVKRPSYGEESQQMNLDLYLKRQGQKLEVPVTIHPQKRTPGQLQELFQRAGEKLEESMLASNPSLDEVRENLNLAAQVEIDGELISVIWLTDPSDLVDGTGVIVGEPKEEGELVRLEAVMNLDGKESVCEWHATVYPRQYAGKEAWLQASKQAFFEAEQAEPYSEHIKLPTQVNGEPVVWSEQTESPLRALAGLAVLALVCLIMREGKRMEGEIQKRRGQLLLDYPAFVFKLAMLLGAGMTIRGAFFRIAREYEKSGGKKRRYAYEEVKITCHEMQSGVAETVAYENFGNRCGLFAYRKLGSILSQNLKKGSQGLANLLEQEALITMEERKGAVRRLGEEAGTKLLFPMMLMLLVVLIILMVPAMMSF